MTEKYHVETQENGWSTVKGGEEWELWRYRWEAEDRAAELNKRAALTSREGSDR